MSWYLQPKARFDLTFLQQSKGPVQENSLDGQSDGENLSLSHWNAMKRSPMFSELLSN